MCSISVDTLLFRRAQLLEGQHSQCNSAVHKHLAVPSINTVHAAQVKDVSGRWIDVVLQEREVAFFLGATAARATGGLLKAAVTRVVCAQGRLLVVRVHGSPCLCHAHACGYATQMPMAMRLHVSLWLHLPCSLWLVWLSISSFMALR